MGLGLATAKEFHANDAKVVISGRDRASLEEVSRQLVLLHKQNGVQYEV